MVTLRSVLPPPPAAMATSASCSACSRARIDCTCCHVCFRPKATSQVLVCPEFDGINARIAYENRGLMKSQIVKRSIVIDGHKTSISLEDAFWSGLKEIAQAHQATLSNVVGEIDRAREQGNLSSAIRLFVLEQVRMSGKSGIK